MHRDSNAHDFPLVERGDIVQFNPHLGNDEEAFWLAAVVANVGEDSIECLVLVQDGDAAQWQPYSNVRWHKDPRLSDPVFAANLSADEDAGRFRFPAKQEYLLGRIDALEEAIRVLLEQGGSDKGSKKAVDALKRAPAAPVKPAPKEADLEATSSTAAWRMKNAKQAEARQDPADKSAALDEAMV